MRPRCTATYAPRHDTPDGYVEEAEKVVSRGFRAYKIHPGVMPARDVTEMVGRVRDSVGFDVRLMLDPNGGYGFRKALEIGRALDDFDSTGTKTRYRGTSTTPSRS